MALGGFRSTIPLGWKAGTTSQAALREQFPEEPWRWRADWAAGRIPDEARRKVAFAWGFGVLWCLVSAPLIQRIPVELERGNRAAALGWLFPAIGAGLIVWALYETLRWARFGSSTLVLHTLPAVIGGRCSGTVQIPRRLRPVSPFEAMLSCVRITSRGTGKRRRVHERLLWQDLRRIEAERWQPGPRGSELPVRFEIPSDVPATSPDTGPDRVEWRLELRHEMRGVDYHAVFRIPVFRMAASERDRDPNSAAADGTTGTNPAAPQSVALDGTTRSFSARSRIRVRTLPGGGVAASFPPLRDPHAALSSLGFTLIWIAATWLPYRHLGVPVLMTAVFAVFAVPLVWLTLRAWFRSVRVEASSVGLSIRTWTLLWLGRRRLPRGEITSIEARQSGSHRGRGRYDIIVRTSSGRSHAAGEQLVDRREAEWLAAELNRAVFGV